MQDQGAIIVEAMQALRVGVRSTLFSSCLYMKLTSISSGDKKTKGAALVF